MPQRDSLGFTILVAVVLCVVCSLAVSAAAVALRPLQEQNKILDRQRNILDAAGLPMGEYGKSASALPNEQVEEMYNGWVSEKLVNLDDGTYNGEEDPTTYDPRAASKSKDGSEAIDGSEYPIGVLNREKVARVYFVKKPGTENIDLVVLPVYGNGLWSTLYGYLALKSDLQTVQGLTFYEHAETPGLGGEVDNPKWKAQWVGLKLYGDDEKPVAQVAKGPAPAGSKTQVDGLSGATITSRGVTNLVRYWASDQGYGPFLTNLKQEIASGPSSEVDDAADESETEQESEAE
ncbi:MAG: Na(+)-translocating NADH-quinone reductase subunit C [Planctomycetota bacterium]